MDSAWPLPGVWKFTKKMNGVQFTFFYENHELVLVLVHNLSMNGRSVHRSFLSFKNEPKFLVPFIATLEDNLFPLFLCFNYNFINYNCISMIILPIQLLKKYAHKQNNRLDKFFYHNATMIDTTTPWFKWTAVHLTRSPNFLNAVHWFVHSMKMNAVCVFVHD